MYVIWNEMCQSVYSGEEGEGWPSYEAALSACVDGADMPAYDPVWPPHRLAIGRRACAIAQANDLRSAAQDAEDLARRAAVVASIAAQAPVVAAKPDRAVTLAKLLASNEAALAACKKTDRAEIARLRDNCSRLRADMGIKTPEKKLLSAIFG